MIMNMMMTDPIAYTIPAAQQCTIDLQYRPVNQFINKKTLREYKPPPKLCKIPFTYAQTVLTKS